MKRDQGEKKNMNCETSVRAMVLAGMLAGAATWALGDMATGGSTPSPFLREVTTGYLLQCSFFLVKTGEAAGIPLPSLTDKSLICSTIKCLYEGRRDLFAGLAIEPLWDWSQANPVVHFSLTDVGSPTPEKLDGSLRRMLNDFALRHSIAIDQDDTPRAFITLLRGIHEKTGRRVVVIEPKKENFLAILADMADTLLS